MLFTGIALALLIACTVKEPKRAETADKVVNNYSSIFYKDQPYSIYVYTIKHI
jgi:outer membrane biogenesis lipoprotein LolB